MDEAEIRSKYEVGALEKVSISFVGRQFPLKSLVQLRVDQLKVRYTIEAPFLLLLISFYCPGVLEGKEPACIWKEI